MKNPFHNSILVTKIKQKELEIRQKKQEFAKSLEKDIKELEKLREARLEELEKFDRQYEEE